MSRKKQLYVDWETLNKLIQAKNQKKVVITMPDNTWYEAYKPPQANQEWAEHNLLEGLQRVIEEEDANAKEKVTSVSEGQYEDAVEHIREGLEIEIMQDEKTVVVLIVMDKEQPANNVAKYIHSQEGICFSGYVKDTAKDSYIVDCVDFVPLGTIPIAFRVAMPMSGHWKTTVPMSEKVVEKLLAPFYKRTLKGLREKYPKPRFAFHYMQMLSCG